jgi:hypothetical protein
MLIFNHLVPFFAEERDIWEIFWNLGGLRTGLGGIGVVLVISRRHSSQRQ